MAQIFGLFGKNQTKFHFLSGEKSYLLDSVGRLNTFLDANITNSDVFFEKLDVTKKKKLKVPTNDLTKISIGFIFGKKRFQPSVSDMQSNVKEEKLSSANLKADLIPRLNSILEMSSVTADMITITNDGHRITASVCCVFCTGPRAKNLCVQYDVPKNSHKAYWNISNFKRHAMKHMKNDGNHDLDIPNTVKTCDEPPEIFLDENQTAKPAMDGVVEDSNNMTTIELVITPNTNKKKMKTTVQIIEDDSPQNVSDELHSNLIYEQISEQNLSLTAAILMNRESVSEMEANFDDIATKIPVIKMKNDGSCLFWALSHQLFQCDVNSQHHHEKTMKLRAEVSTHIENNYDKYELVIQGRVLDNNEIYSKDAGLFFVKVMLRNPKCWGGTESIKAVSEIYKVNIIVFNEAETCSFPLGFVQDYKRTIAVAYRIGITRRGKINRNHYDSVAEFKQDVLLKCAAILAAKETNRVKMLSGVHELNDLT